MKFFLLICITLMLGWINLSLESDHLDIKNYNEPNYTEPDWVDRYFKEINEIDDCESREIILRKMLVELITESGLAE